MSLRKQQRENNVEYFENIEELERDGKLLVTPPPIQLDEVEANEEVLKLRDGCFLAMTRKLSLNQRIAFSLVDMFGLSIKEVSEILDITPKAVKGLLYRARLNLESFFQGHCSFLDINNPCTCKEWIEFMSTRNSIQKKMRQSLTVLNYKQNGYVQNTKTTQMILHYYHSKVVLILSAVAAIALLVALVPGILGQVLCLGASGSSLRGFLRAALYQFL